MEPHLKTLWCWQRERVLETVTVCLECFLDGDEAGFWDNLNQLDGKPKQVALLCIRDCLRYVQFKGERRLKMQSICDRN